MLVSAATHALCNGDNNSGNSDHIHTLFDQRLLSILHQKQTSLLQIAQQSPVLTCVD